MRIRFGPCPRFGQTHFFHQLEHPGSRLPGTHAALNSKDFRDLIAHRLHGVQRTHRVLKNHRDFAATDPAHGLAVQFQEVLTGPVHLTAGVDPRVVRQQLQQTHCGHALAAARLAHQGDCLLIGDGKTDFANSFMNPR